MKENSNSKILIPKKDLKILTRNTNIFRDYNSIDDGLSDNQKFTQLAVKYHLSPITIRKVVCNYKREFQN